LRVADTPLHQRGVAGGRDLGGFSDRPGIGNDVEALFDKPFPDSRTDTLRSFRNDSGLSLAAHSFLPQNVYSKEQIDFRNPRPARCGNGLSWFKSTSWRRTCQNAASPSRASAADLVGAHCAGLFSPGVFATQSKPAMIAFLDLDWRRKYADGSLNTGVSFAKDGSASNLGEQVDKIRNWPSIELLDCLDESVSEIFIGEGFAQPVELLEDTIPGHGVVEVSLIADMFFFSRAAGP
jgi:hypothetical protein